jgi:hypothetical protein
MGFKSGLRRNQATEDDVTIAGGPFAGGTTMHVSYLRLRLGTWYGQLSQHERVARMYAPQVTPEQAGEFTTDAESDPDLLGQAITRYGVIGHAQTCARARRDGRPVILRRDFDTTDGGLAGLHFVSLQRTIADFAATRTAMNAAGAQLQNPSVTDTVNNGINEFIFVLRRGNYVVPPRARRSFPQLPGRETALALISGRKHHLTCKDAASFPGSPTPPPASSRKSKPSVVTLTAKVRVNSLPGPLKAGREKGRLRKPGTPLCAQTVLLQTGREPTPFTGAEAQHGAALPVVRVTDQDRAGGLPRLDAVHAVAAVAGLPPAGVYLLHLSFASKRMSRLPARLSASLRTLLKVDDARLTSTGSLES